MTAVGLPPVPAAPRPPRRAAVDWTILGVLVLVLTFAVRALVAQAFFIPSASMEPQLHVHDRILVSKLSYRLHDVRLGDIVVFKEPAAARALGGSASEDGPSNPVVRVLRSVGQGIGLVPPSTSDFVKRVIGLPGHTVEGIAGSVYIDGHLLVEPYLPEGAVTEPFPPVLVAKGHLWVMGDNRGDSDDSRVFGPIPATSVVGRTVVRVWPVWHTSFL